MSRLSERYAEQHGGRYPDAPGFKTGGTSAAAAAAISGLHDMQRAVLAAIVQCPSTADEVAAALGWSILSARPRCSELKKLNLIVDSKVRRPNASGRRAVVWRAA